MWFKIFSITGKLTPAAAIVLAIERLRSCGTQGWSGTPSFNSAIAESSSTCAFI